MNNHNLPSPRYVEAEVPFIQIHNERPHRRQRSRHNRRSVLVNSGFLNPFLSPPDPELIHPAHPPNNHQLPPT
jgi:hypothetical protein